MNKKIWKLVVLIVGFGMLTVLFLSVFAVKWRVDVSQREGDDLYRLFEERKIGQTFIARKNNLSRITLDLKNASLLNEKPIYFHLREVGGSQDLRTVGISGFNIGDPSSVRFQFESIPDSFQKSYYFYLDSPDSTENEGIEVYHSQKDFYPEGKMIVNDEELKGDIRFSSFYFSDSKTESLKETIGIFISRLFVDRVFISFYLILLVLIFSFGLFSKSSE